MKKNENHPAIVSAKKKMKTRYTIAAVSLLICIAVFALGCFIKPKADLSKTKTFSKDTEAGAFVKSEITLTSALFSQDTTDDNGNITGEMYHILAVDTDRNRFILSAPKEFYEEKLQFLEDNSVQDIGEGTIDILDSEKKVEVYGYTREMSNNLKQQLNENFSGYETVLFPYSLEAVENPEEIEPLNYFYIAAGFIAVITLCILFTAVSATADYSRKKEKLEKKLAERAKSGK